MVIPQHILDLQVLDGDDLVFVNEPCGELLQEVPADIPDMLVDAGDADALLVAVARAWHLPCKAALLPRELPLILPKDARIGNRPAVAVGEELLETDIDADLPRAARRESDIFLDAQRYEVFAGGRARDGGIQDAPVEVAALADTDAADFRQAKMVLSVEADAVLLVACAVTLLMPSFRLEARVSREFLEELLEGRIKIPQGFLQCHGIRFFQPRRFLTAFHFRQETARVFVADGDMVSVPLIASQGKEMVVYKTAATECFVDTGCLCRVRVDAILIAASGRHDVHAPFLPSLYHEG